jgi:thiamine biosynthesis protein ThiC
MGREVQIAKARHELDWDEQFRLALYGEHARKIHERERSTYFTVSFPATASATCAIVTARVFENGIDQPNRIQSMVALP